MPRKIELCEGLERRRLIALYKKLRGIVEAQLEGLEKSEEGPSAAMLDTLCRSLKQLNGLLDDLAKSERSMEAAERSKSEASTLMSELPAPTRGRLYETQTLAPVEEMTLPFKVKN
jgi:hypothetical protein